MPFEELVLGFVCGAAGSLILWITIGRRMMLKYAGVSVARAIANPDEEMKVALNGLMSFLWTWLNTATIEVDGPLGSDDKPTKLKISPMQAVLSGLIDTIVQKIWLRLAGAKGAAVKDVNRLASEALGGIPLGPRKGQSSGEFFVEQMLTRLGPKLQTTIEEAINKRLGNVIKDGMQE